MTDVAFPSVFALRLPRSTRRQATELAKRDGLSLNQFITLAVAEKIVRLEAAQPGVDRPPNTHTEPGPGSKFFAS